MKRSLRSVSALMAFVLTLSIATSMAVPVSAKTSETLWLEHTVYEEEVVEPDVPDPLPDPVLMKFNDPDPWYRDNLGEYVTNKPIYAFYEDDNGTQGSYEFVTLDDGTGCLKLNYSEHASWSPYRVMPKFREVNYVTADHKYVRITYMTTDEYPCTISMYNNGGGGGITLVKNTGVSQGEWVRSNAIDISAIGGNYRFSGTGDYTSTMHCTVQYHSTQTNSNIYIKEIAFFASEDQAYSYYSDSPLQTEFTFSRMSFDLMATGTVNVGDTYGANYLNEETGDLDIVYAESTNLKGWNDDRTARYPMKYMAKIKFKSGSSMDPTHRFMRVLYAAENPEGLSGKTDIYLSNDRVEELVLVAENIEDTNGEYVLSDTVYIPDDMIERFSGTGYYSSPIHNSLAFNANREGGKYSIKAVYFFPTRDTADLYSYNAGTTELTISGNDISEYQIVICEDAPIKITEAASALASRIETLTGVTVPIVTDTTPESEYEILIGISNRALSYERNAEATSHQYAYGFVSGDTMVFSSPQAAATRNIVYHFIDRHLYSDMLEAPTTIGFTENLDFTYNYTSLNTYEWDTFENVAEPDRYFDAFGFDNGFWCEENAADDWYFEGYTYNSVGNGKTLSYLHTYEPDVEYNMDIMYTDADGNGDFGLMLRYNSAEAYVKAGYDFESGEWHITSREGGDFYVVRNASAEAEIEPNKWYSLKFILDGADAVLYVNGEEILSADDITQLTPGRIAVYANDVSMRVDNADIYMLSGEGTVIPGVAHTKLETGAYTEGGSVHELNDGTLVYHHQNGYAYYSDDNGVSWVEGEPCFPTKYGYMNVLRLLPTEGQEYGDFMQIVTSGGMVYSATSSDEGKTWTLGDSPICYNKYHLDGVETKAGAGNMNDKLTQSATTGRIFYSQNYEAPSTAPVNGRTVFCEFYYSDDNGNTWTKSDTDSWEIAGNESVTHFGECKILECADGTLRMYNSWNDYGCIVYSDSTDNGETWGELQFMEDFPCARSSMQFCRDPYAENNTTYYMVWVNSVHVDGMNLGMPRSRLTLAKSTDGKNWDVLGDVWRWESGYQIGAAFVNHVVDPFITVSEDYVIVGSGFSENMGLATDAAISSWHQSQRQHIYSIKKSTLGAEFPPVIYLGDADRDGEATLLDLAAFNRYLAKWSGYTAEKYDFSTFDFNDDGAITPLDGVLFARHLANWDMYKDISLIKYAPSVADDKYVLSGGMTVAAEGYASDVGLPAIYSGYYYRYDNRVVELATGTKATIYSPIKLRSYRVYRVDSNNVLYVEDELNGTLPDDGSQGNSHWLSSSATTRKIVNRDYAKYGIFDVTGDKNVRYNDYTWFISNDVNTVSAKITEFKTLLAAVINTAVENGKTYNNADYSTIPGYAEAAYLASLKTLAKPYISAGKTVTADDIVLSEVPATVHGIELQGVGAVASFDADGYLTLSFGTTPIITADDKVSDLVLVNQNGLAIWRYSEQGDEVLEVLRTSPQVGIVGKPGQNDAYGKFFERSLRDGIAVVMVGYSNTDK